MEVFGKEGKDGARAVEGMVRRETERGVKEEGEETVVEEREEDASEDAKAAWVGIAVAQ